MEEEEEEETEGRTDGGRTRSAAVRDALEIVGIFALVASLVFVGFELRQAHRIAMADTQVALLEGMQQGNQAIGDHADVWIRGAAGERLGGADSVVFANLVFMKNEEAVANFLRYVRLGEDDVAATVVSDFATFLLRNPGAIPVWRDREDALIRSRTILNPDRSREGRFWRDRVLERLRRLGGSAG